jgi:hypothetical protein
MQIISRATAKALGLRFYFTGKPCPHGHIAERSTPNGMCSICHRERQRTVYHRRREQAGELKRFTGKPCIHGHTERRAASGNCIACEIAAMKQWRDRNPGKVKEGNDRRDPEKLRLDAINYYWENVETLRPAAKLRRRIAYHRDPETEVARSVAYRKNNLAKVHVRLRRWQKEKLATDIVFRLKATLRGRINKALRGKTKAGSAVRDLGCSVAELIAWLENQFAPGMTWENYGPVWHVDHKEPLAAFDLTDPAQFKRACHYTNLQPLFARDNHRKGPRHHRSQTGVWATT